MKFIYFYKYQRDEYVELYERASNWQTVKYAPSGEPFIRINGKIYTLSQFMPLSSVWCGGEPFEIKTDSGKTAILSASEIDGYPFPYFLEIDETTERVRAFQYYKTQFI